MSGSADGYGAIYEAAVEWDAQVASPAVRDLLFALAVYIVEDYGVVFREVRLEEGDGGVAGVAEFGAVGGRAVHEEQVDLALVAGRYALQFGRVVPLRATPGVCGVGEGGVDYRGPFGKPLSFERLDEQVGPRFVVLDGVDVPRAALSEE